MAKAHNIKDDERIARSKLPCGPKVPKIQEIKTHRAGRRKTATFFESPSDLQNHCAAIMTRDSPPAALSSISADNGKWI